jgi:hypothetical protein
MCFRVRLAFLTPTMRVVRLFSPELSYCVIAIRLPHVTSHLLLDCSLFRFLISFVHFIPSFENTAKFINTQKNDYIPTLVLLPVFGPFVTLPSLPDSFRSRFYDTSILSPAGDVPPPSPIRMSSAQLSFRRYWVLYSAVTKRMTIMTNMRVILTQLSVLRCETRIQHK